MSQHHLHAFDKLSNRLSEPVGEPYQGKPDVRFAEVGIIVSSILCESLL